MSNCWVRTCNVDPIVVPAEISAADTSSHSGKVAGTLWFVNCLYKLNCMAQVVTINTN